MLHEHFCVFFESASSLNRNVQTKVVKRHYITESMSELFIEKLSSTPALSSIPVNELVDRINCKVENIIDSASTKVKVVSGRRRSP